jgi:glucosyl-3-phosphoglycerate synthase
VTRDEWLRRRTFRGSDYDPADLLRRKREQGVTVSVGLPCLDVEDTVGPIVRAIRERWMEEVPLVDQLAAIDSHSTDGTAAAAARAGAEVYEEPEILPEAGPGRGKGEALWKSLVPLRGDLVLWLDSDVEDFDPAFVPGMLGPLLTDPGVGYVKAFYHRPMGDLGGGRVTEICARPLLNLFRPDLAALAQPLAGEAAGRRTLLERLPFFTGYAVEIGLLLDIHRRHGLAPIAQVDLGERRHRHQQTVDLGRMAHAITRAVLRREAEEGRMPERTAEHSGYARPVGDGPGLHMREVDVPLQERPAMADMPGYRSVRALAPGVRA